MVADLRSYYEREAELGLRSPVGDRRRNIRDRLIETLDAEGRRSVIDYGAGPGRDGVGFAAAGIRYVGLDLAYGNARLARTDGLDVLHASIAEPPIRAGVFDAGWSMSTFMHVPADEAAAVARAMARPLRSGSPLAVGLWGGPRRDEVDTDRLEGERRLFSLRTVEQNTQLLTAAGAVEHVEVSDVGPDGWEYQLMIVRVA